MSVEGKKITIIGAEESGVNAAVLAERVGAIAFVSDIKKKPGDKYLNLLQKKKIEFEFGKHSDKVFDCELLIVSPGVAAQSEVVQKALERKIKVISEIEFASWFCKGTIIAITGTNGKSTVTKLCEHLLNRAGFKTYSAGNIGNAFSSISLDVKPDEYVSLEVSSFQLDYIDTFKPKIALILNITPDHLNRYDNKFENYARSKMRIFENQNENDYLIINKDDVATKEFLREYRSRLNYFSLNQTVTDGAYISDKKITFNNHSTAEFSCNLSDLNENTLRGEHNYANALASICAAKILGADNKKIIKGLKTYSGLEHRIELVRELNGVKFINDSKATNVDSTYYALKSFDSPLLLILGGEDKGNDYNKIKRIALNKVKKIFAIGMSAQKIYDFFNQDINVEIKAALEDSIEAAYKESVKGDVILLSPACASKDMFTDYKHRGRVFKDFVKNLK